MSVTQYSRQLAWVAGEDLRRQGALKEELMRPGRVFLWDQGRVGYQNFYGGAHPLINHHHRERRPPVFARLPLRGSLCVIRRSGQGRADNEITMLPTQFMQPASDGHSLNNGISNYYGRYIEHDTVHYLAPRLIGNDEPKQEVVVDVRELPAYRVIQSARLTLEDYPRALLISTDGRAGVRNLRGWLEQELRVLSFVIPKIDADGILQMTAEELRQIGYETTPAMLEYTDEDMATWEAALLHGSDDDAWAFFKDRFPIAPTA